MEKNKITIKMAKVILSTTFMNLIPLVFTVLIWMFLVLMGFGWIKGEFQHDKSYPLLVMMWVIVSISLTKILVPHPSITWEEETWEEETLDKK